MIPILRNKCHSKEFFPNTFRDFHHKLRKEFTNKMRSHLKKFDTFEVFYKIPLSTGIIIFNIRLILLRYSRLRLIGSHRSEDILTRLSGEPY